MNEEKTLRELLHQHLHSDQNGAPDFDRLWTGAIAQRRRRRVHLALASSAAVLLALLASTFIHSARKQTLATASDVLPWRSQVLITEWHSPTDSLLPADFH
jgi:type VI protein secretion system component VasF